MFAVVEKKFAMPKTRYFGPAQVMELNLVEGLVRLQIDGMEEDTEIWARLAIPYANLCKPGASVLVAGEGLNDIYIIGLLSKGHNEEPDHKSLVLKNGAKARITGNTETERLEVRSRVGELIFEHDPETGKSRVNIQSGDLEIVTQEGNIDFISAGDIRFSSQQSIELKSLLGIRMMTTDLLGSILSSVTLNFKKLCLQSPIIGITAQRGDIHVEDSSYIGKKFVGRMGHAKLIVGKIETLANDIIEKAKSVYRTVEGLTQLKTGRMRTMVDASYHLKAKKAFLKAEEDFKVKAEKIHLG